MKKTTKTKKKLLTDQKKMKYCCEFCNYNTSKKTDYNRHILTQKHKKRIALGNVSFFFSEKRLRIL